MYSTLYFERPAMNPVSFYLSHLAKDEQYDEKQMQIDEVKNLHQQAFADSATERRRVAEHPATSPETLLKLSRDIDPEVRLSAGEHPKLPFFALKRLVKDPCLDVRFGLAENSNIPTSILVMLVKDENPYIEARARRSLDRRNSSIKLKLWVA